MITLTTEQAQQIEEALDKLNLVYGLHETPCVAKALATIRAAIAQEQAEQQGEAVAKVVVDFDFYGTPIFDQISKDLAIGDKVYAAPQKREWVELSDEDRAAAFNSLPDMLDGFLKKWGWLHFANEIERRCMEKQGIFKEANK